MKSLFINKSQGLLITASQELPQSFLQLKYQDKPYLRVNNKGRFNHDKFCFRRIKEVLADNKSSSELSQQK